MHRENLLHIRKRRGSPERGVQLCRTVLPLLTLSPRPPLAQHMHSVRPPLSPSPFLSLPKRQVVDRSRMDVAMEA